jgi:hypothetical protein
MSSVSDEFASFSQFAHVRLQSEPVESLEELVYLWRLEHPSDEGQGDVHAAIREGLEDLKAGRYRAAADVSRDLRRKYNLPE